MCFCTHAFKYEVNSTMTPAAIMFTEAPIPASVLNSSVLAGLGDGLVDDAGDGLVDDEHAQYNEDELPLSSSLLFAFTPPEGQLVASLA
jgi:hypothetical protein